MTNVFKTDSDLREMVKDYKGVSFATLEMVTKPKCNVKSRTTKEPYEALFNEGTIICTSRRFVTVGNNYEKAVNNRREKEFAWDSFDAPEKFETESLPWGNWVEGSKVLIEHNGTTYLRVYYLNANSYKSEKFYHYENGNPISEELIERLKAEFLPIKKENEKQELEKENQVIVNTVKLSGIVRLHFSGDIYVREEFASGEELRTRVSEVLMNSKVAGNAAITLKDVYDRLNVRTPRDKSKVRWILTDHTCFRQDGNGLYKAC